MTIITPQDVVSEIKNTAITRWSTDADILSSVGCMDSTKWTLGLLPSLDSEEIQEAINKLASNAEMPNPFFELSFLTAAKNHIGKGDLKFLYLSQTIGDEETLKLFAPVQFERKGLFRQKIMRTWNHDYAPLGLPLIDRDSSDEVIGKLIDCLLDIKKSEAEAILLEFMPRHSQLTEKLYRSASLTDYLHRFSHSERAVLEPVKNNDYDKTYISGKRRQRLRKGMERLAGFGIVTFDEARDPKNVMVRLDEFLSLEAIGWKGKKGTALNGSEGTVALAREAATKMAADERCTIHTLRLDDKAVASMILFKSNGHFYPWKIAFDEAYAFCSAGNNLLVHVNQILAAEDDFKGLDSLAAEDNETAYRFWPQRMELYSMVIGIGQNSKKNASKIAWQLDRLKRWKRLAKEILNRS